MYEIFAVVVMLSSNEVALWCLLCNSTSDLTMLSHKAPVYSEYTVSQRLIGYEKLTSFHTNKCSLLKSIIFSVRNVTFCDCNNTRRSVNKCG
jgi:hypothetical protein